MSSPCLFFLLFPSPFHFHCKATEGGTTVLGNHPVFPSGREKNKPNHFSLFCISPSYSWEFTSDTPGHHTCGLLLFFFSSRIKQFCETSWCQFNSIPHYLHGDSVSSHRLRAKSQRIVLHFRCYWQVVGPQVTHNFCASWLRALRVSYFWDFYGVFHTKVWSIINSFSHSSSFSREWGMGLKISSFEVWLCLSRTLIQEPAGSLPRAAHKTKFTPVSEEIARVSGPLCQESSSRTKYIEQMLLILLSLRNLRGF